MCNFLKREKWEKLCSDFSQRVEHLSTENASLREECTANRSELTHARELLRAVERTDEHSEHERQQLRQHVHVRSAAISLSLIVMLNCRSLSDNWRR